MASPNSKKIPKGSLKDAVDRGLDFLGPEARGALIFNLKEKYGIDLDRADVHIEEMKKPLEELFGSGSEFIIKSIKGQLE